MWQCDARSLVVKVSFQRFPSARHLLGTIDTHLVFVALGIPHFVFLTFSTNSFADRPRGTYTMSSMYVFQCVTDIIAGFPRVIVSVMTCF